MSEQETVAALFRGLGATPSQAEVMASQILRRADQIAVERSQSREEALRILLEAVVKGRRGEAPDPGMMPPAENG